MSRAIPGNKTDRVAVIPTGVANVASMMSALRRAGLNPWLTSRPVDVRDSERVVLPGVGDFGSAAEFIESRGLAGPLRERIAEGRATLAVCVGMQLLAQGSEEAPGAKGLGIIQGKFRRFRGPGPTPQMGLNRVVPAPHPLSAGAFDAGEAYFANSYRLTEAPRGWDVAWSRHGERFVSALGRGRVLGCQFHPELSGDWGLALLSRWGWGENVPEKDSEKLGLLDRARPRLIACLDIRDGRVVKGTQFQQLRDAGDPAAKAQLYAEMGATELVVLDVSATAEGRSAALETIRAIRERTALPVAVGGGVRRGEDVDALLSHGADKVAINTAAMLEPALIGRLSGIYGRQCIVASIDAARGAPGEWEVVIRSGTQRTGRNAIEWAREVADRGAGEILLTSWDRDGTRRGYDLPLLNAVSSAVSVPVVASGGAGRPEDLVDAVRAGAQGVLAASLFHDDDLDAPLVRSLASRVREAQRARVDGGIRC